MIGPLLPVHSLRNFGSKKFRPNCSVKMWRRRLRLAAVKCHCPLPKSAWEIPPTCLGKLHQSQCWREEEEYVTPFIGIKHKGHWIWDCPLSHMANFNHALRIVAAGNSNISVNILGQTENAFITEHNFSCKNFAFKFWKNAAASSVTNFFFLTLYVTIGIRDF